MNVQFRGPSSENDALDVEGLLRLIAEAGPTYWRRESAMADLSCLDGPNKGATMGVIVEPELGTMLRYTPASGEDEFILTNPARPDGDKLLVVYPGGNEWEVPRRYFVDLDVVSEVIRTFYESGGRADGEWIVLGME